MTCSRTWPWTADRFVADLDAVRQHFALDRPVLLGHSWGAQLALSYALAHPERVGGLVYVGGAGIDPVSTWREPFQENFRARLGEMPEHFARWQELTDGDRGRPAHRRRSARAPPAPGRRRAVRGFPRSVSSPRPAPCCTRS
ncbi:MULTISPECIES: alpha/beta fold hydrolase [unclassified Streptomyces]|uniref:alpha/beta fold hydrolase n=1 Tax=unclassified Streptomyces TaxID=2593676 RepID=UPI0036F05A37